MDTLWWILGGLFALAAAAWRAFVLLAMWAWFVMPLGAPRITFAQAFGLVLIVNMLMHPGSIGTGIDLVGDPRTSLTSMVLGPLIVLALGAFVYAYVSF